MTARRSSIEWCDHTWNPITGCWHGCDYCYARTMTNRFSGDVRANLSRKAEYTTLNSEKEGEHVFSHIYKLEKPMLDEEGKQIIYPFGFEPTLHEYRMKDLDEMPGKNVFVGAMSDIFGYWVPSMWIKDIIAACSLNLRHNYLFLSKNPERYKYYTSGLNNFWWGTTITCNDDLDRIKFLPSGTDNTFVSIEPLLGPVFKNDDERNWFAEVVDWCIIGAETGRRKGKVEPAPRWIADITKTCKEAGIPVFMKNSMAPFVGGVDALIQDYPERMQMEKLTKKMESKLIGQCCRCKLKGKKADMVTIGARSMRGEHAKEFCFMHRDCFREFCSDMDVRVPDLKGLQESE